MNDLHNTPRRIMTVAELMSQVVHTAKETDAVRHAHSVMRVSRIRHLPVLDEDGALIGVVSDRDVQRGWTRGPETRIADVMSRHLQWVHPDTSARAAAERLLHDKIGCLPVLNDKKEVVGIVTDTDFIEVAHRALTMLEALSAEQAT